MSAPSSRSVRVYVVTYRRPVLLERALRSVIAQTHRDWIVEVLNDDPADARVEALIGRLGDLRITLSTPSVRRGGTGNFNRAFRTVAEPFASILEDDNWWEPDFLATMLQVLEERAHVSAAVANEKLWIERADGSWVDSGRTIWPVSDAVGEFGCDPLDKCGGAKVCNSSMLFRTAGADAWSIPPSVPIDVSEHFRERVIPHPIALVHRPLVNYAETLVTHRTKGYKLWGQYQLLLVASVFALARTSRRAALATALWREARTSRPMLANTLVAAGLFFPEARDLWRTSALRERLRFARSSLRRPASLVHALRATRELHDAWRFLTGDGWFARYMRECHAAAP